MTIRWTNLTKSTMIILITKLISKSWAQILEIIYWGRPWKKANHRNSSIGKVLIPIMDKIIVILIRTKTLVTDLQELGVWLWVMIVILILKTQRRFHLMLIIITAISKMHKMMNQVAKLIAIIRTTCKLSHSWRAVSKIPTPRIL